MTRDGRGAVRARGAAVYVCSAFLASSACSTSTLSIGRDRSDAAADAPHTDTSADRDAAAADTSDRCGDAGRCPANTVCCPSDQPCHDTCVPDCRVDGGPRCMGNTVCCPSDLACRGNCMPDCRVDGQPGCGAGTACEVATGLCR